MRDAAAEEEGAEGAASAAAAGPDSVEGDATMLEALEGHGLTPQQQQLVQQLLQQQAQQLLQQGVEDSDDACSDSGTEVDTYDEGEYVSMEDEGIDMDVPAAEATFNEPKQGTAQWYRSKLTEQLWQLGDASAELRVYQAIFMLMAWKADHCVRDNAFGELLGMLSQLFLPKVRLQYGHCDI
jgi:hypothetical protein